MSPRQRTGRPLFVLAAILIGWSAMRFALWDPSGYSPSRFVESGHTSGRLAASDQPAVPVRTRGEHEPDAGAIPVPTRIPSPAAWPPSKLVPGTSRAAEWPSSLAMATPQTVYQVPARTSGQTAAAHNLLWMPAMARLPMPEGFRKVLAGSAGPSEDISDPRASHQRKRLSLDSWVFLRSGARAPIVASPRPSAYGRSQAGAVWRYDLAPRSAFLPQVFARISRALVADGESDLALGLSVRPLAAIPLTAHAEARATRANGRTEIRPAAFVTTGLDRRNLPLGLGLRGYAQAGYVGGEFATGFADGNLVVDREVARFDLGRVRAGAGTWGGAQSGASRLDLGPTASLDVQIGETPVRLSVDYRVRVAGDATPGTGAALTLSTGF